MFKKNLGQILSGFTRTINQLDAFIQESNGAITYNAVTITDLQSKNADLNIEVQKAQGVADKLRELVEG